MRVISIDPGYDRCGIAVLEKRNNKEHILFSECIQTNSKDSLQERLFQVGLAVEKNIKNWSPEYLAIEGLFFAKNTKTAMAVSQVRGIIIFQGMRAQLPIFEYTPNQIKLAVAGHGSADKKDVHGMVTLLVSLDSRVYKDDEIDAIAVGLTFLSSYRKYADH